MEEAHRTHKEPAWGWISVLLAYRRGSEPVCRKTGMTATRRRAFTAR